jgi:sporulation protein YlmC with PRC-barrel domain
MTSDARRELDAALHLLDRQVIDKDGRPAGKVDDLELTERKDGAPYVSAILSGSGALGPRISRRWGRWGTWLTSLHRVDFSLVHRIGSDVSVIVSADDLGAHDAERWARDHVIGHIPGARHASE